MIEMTMASGYALMGDGVYWNSKYNKETEIMSYIPVYGLDEVKLFKRLDQAREAQKDLADNGVPVKILKFTLEKVENE